MTLPLVVASRENVRSKAARYLIEGRVSVLYCNGSSARAAVRGNGHLYDVSYERGHWTCACAARGTCSHITATQQVVVVR